MQQLCGHLVFKIMPLHWRVYKRELISCVVYRLSYLDWTHYHTYTLKERRKEIDFVCYKLEYIYMLYTSNTFTSIAVC